MTPENKKRAGAEDAGYAAWMAETVEPYLKEHGKKGYLKMEDGMSIAYRCYSLPDARKCVVISHGFCEFAEKYNEVAYRFLQEGYSVYVPEHRGHGYSGREVDDPELVHVQSYDRYVEDFAAFVEKVVSPREEHRIVFAHSMGGAIAVLAAFRCSAGAWRGRRHRAVRWEAQRVLPKNDSKKKKKRIEIKEKQNGEQKLPNEDLLSEKLLRPMVQLSYAAAMDLVQARLRLINADLTEQCHRQVIRNMSCRIKTPDSVTKKLKKKGREVSFEEAVQTLNDIAGIRVVCFFCDDIYRIADAIKKQKDFHIIKEKDYVKNPKKSGYQSIHVIAGVPVTYNDTVTEIRVEIQIRSFAMDYWAELDTQMCYKKDAGQIANVERETRGYSDVIAKVDNKMLELRQQIEMM